MASGIVAKLLHVDLTTRKTWTEEIPEILMRKYLGGGSLACHILLRDMPAGVDPLGPDNILVFMTSVVNGLSLSGTNRYTAAAKSPLTGGYGEAEAGGWWGPELRAAGLDGLDRIVVQDAPPHLKDDVPDLCSHRDLHKTGVLDFSPDCPAGRPRRRSFRCSGSSTTISRSGKRTYSCSSWSSAGSPGFSRRDRASCRGCCSGSRPRSR